MTGMQWWAVIIRGGKIFVDLIFVVKGTHENLNTMKISVYMVYIQHNRNMYMFKTDNNHGKYMYTHVYVHHKTCCAYMYMYINSSHQWT